ncbi:MAG: hydroxymethylglutaryl-CoA reductase, degradative [Gammaproteobacteria bacterium]|nr:hydroxymethylglutaryl-CoA reductase, degradative [Gammaproteobacteria bacterium]
MSDSRIPGLYRLPVGERIARLRELGWLGDEDAAKLEQGQHVLSVTAADHMIENVVGVFGLPLAVVPNFVVNGRDCVVPLVVEEPSIVAGLSSAAALARSSGGFEVDSDGSLLVGQVHVTNLADPDQAISALEAVRASLVAAANAVHPRLVERGGGVRDIETRLFALPDGAPLVGVHVLVDTCDAMGANLVNSICEAIAPEIARVCGGKVALRILSNLTDRSLFTVRGRFRLPDAVRDAIITANDIALVDPYRAATHNKGIMNGIDAVAIATGNDWRALEAGAHAWAAAAGQYRSLTRWSVAAGGHLLGEMTIPLKVGTVGGTVAGNSAASLGLALTGAASAGELAAVMAAVGLAQNFAALRALATSGIQAGHMKLHARSLAASAGASDREIDAVVERLVASGDIKDWKAREIVAELGRADNAGPDGVAAGKVILLGEHGVVYGRHALAVPVPDAVAVTLTESERLVHELPDEYVAQLLAAIGITDTGWRIQVDSRLPLGKGLGSSAAIAVAMTRAFDKKLGLGLDDARVNAIALESEKYAHGTPSGIDNTLATYGRPMLFHNDGGLQFETLETSEAPPLLIAWGAATGRTSELVAGVRRRRDRTPAHFDAVFDRMDALSREGAELLAGGRWRELGALMDLCHGLLNAIGVSTTELERMVSLARLSGAAGAKLTGAGGGGAIVALCPENIDKVRAAMRRCGYHTLVPGTLFE